MALPEHTAIFTGLLALLPTIGFFAEGVFSVEKRALFGLVATIYWAIWGFSVNEIDVMSGGIRQTYAAEPLAIMGYLTALVMGLLFFYQALEMLGD